MQIKDLEGALLDYWVAQAEGVEVTWNHPGNRDAWIGHYQDREYVLFNPSTDWAQGGPIIEREEISLLPGPWSAQVFLEDGLRSFEGNGLTPLIAAMRAYVASRFGHEVPDLPA